MAEKATSYRYNPLHQDIICDETAIDELPRTVDALGCGRVMITCGPPSCRRATWCRESGGAGPPLRRHLPGSGAPLSGGDRGGRGGNGPGTAARRLRQRRRRQHPRHHQGHGHPAGRGRRHPRLRDYLRASRQDNRAPDSLTQAADTERAHHHGLRRVQPRRGRNHRPSTGAQAHHRGRGRDPPHGHHRRAGPGHNAAAHPGLHGHRAAAHRHRDGLLHGAQSHRRRDGPARHPAAVREPAPAARTGTSTRS